MLDRILKQFKQEPRTRPEDDRRLATAVLLYEVAHADFEHSPLEIDTLRETLAAEFRIAGDELDRLLENANQKQREAISLYDFVSALNRQLGQDERKALVRLLWRVAFSDGKLDPHEEHRIRNIAELLHVPHADFIRAKLRESDS